MEKCLYPHIFLLYCVISGLVGVSLVSAIVTITLVFLLEKFKLPMSGKGAAKRVLESDKSSIIAHRGAGHDAPENTIAAFKKVESADILSVHRMWMAFVIV